MGAEHFNLLSKCFPFCLFTEVTGVTKQGEWSDKHPGRRNFTEYCRFEWNLPSFPNTLSNLLHTGLVMELLFQVYLQPVYWSSDRFKAWQNYEKSLMSYASKTSFLILLGTIGRLHGTALAIGAILLSLALAESVSTSGLYLLYLNIWLRALRCIYVSQRLRN